MAFVTKGVSGHHDDNENETQAVERDWRRGVTYQIYPRSFADGNNDGVGDLVGATARLAHVKSLGVDTVWMSPWFTSPMADGGYDVADYCDIAPMFGTLADADTFMAECRRLDLKVMIDLVANHCSSAHPWFQRALADGPGSPARDWFYFRDGRGENGEIAPSDWVSIFGGPAWTRVTEADGTPGQWYLHLFDSGQPDLNWTNPAVRQAFDEIFRFWFDRGVDGFRLDAVPAIGKETDFRDAGCDPTSQFAPETSPQTRYWDAGDVHEVVKHWREVAESYEPAKYLVGEINVSTSEALLRYIAPGELQSVFVMNLTKAPWSAEAFRTCISASLTFDPSGESWPTWVLSSHDEVRTVTRFARLSDGTADLERGTQRARAALLITLALPGAACLYQGEELGLPQVLDLPREVLEDPIVARTGIPEKGRDGCRVALPWDTSAPAFGFGDVAPRMAQPTNWAGLSVSAQEADPTSFLHFTRATLRARANYLATVDAEVKWVSLGEGVLAFDRGDVRCIVNFSERPVALDEHALIVAQSCELVNHQLPPDAGVWVLR